mgnify:CR=1 FL=1
MKLKIKLAEKRLKKASKKLDKWEVRFYERQRVLQDLYKESSKQNIHDEAAMIEADLVALSAWDDGVVVKEKK